jgi:FMN phosphatase YigB (HAD superfamily)
VFLFDVDNTLLDNDRVQDDLRSHLEREFGPETRDRYFAILEGLYAVVDSIPKDPPER